MSTLSAVVADLEAAIAAVPVRELPGLRAELARLDTVALLRASASAGGPVEADRAAAGSDRLLTAEELAERLGKSVWWIYRQARRPDALPFRKDLPGGRYGFSEQGLAKWLARRSA